MNIHSSVVTVGLLAFGLGMGVAVGYANKTVTPYASDVHHVFTVRYRDSHAQCQFTNDQSLTAWALARGKLDHDWIDGTVKEQHNILHRVLKNLAPNCWASLISLNPNNYIIDGMDTPIHRSKST